MYKLEQFYRDWKISLNTRKSELIVCAKKIANVKIFQPITVYGHTITPTICVKYLEIFLDSRLTFKHHIKQIIGKVSTKEIVSTHGKKCCFNIEKQKINLQNDP